MVEYLKMYEHHWDNLDLEAAEIKHKAINIDQEVAFVVIAMLYEFFIDFNKTNFCHPFFGFLFNHVKFCIIFLSQDSLLGRGWQT